VVAELGAERADDLLLPAARRQLAGVILDRVVQEHAQARSGSAARFNSRTRRALGSTARARSMACHCCI